MWPYTTQLVLILADSFNIIIFLGSLSLLNCCWCCWCCLARCHCFAVPCHFIYMEIIVRMPWVHLHKVDTCIGKHFLGFLAWSRKMHRNTHPDPSIKQIDVWEYSSGSLDKWLNDPLIQCADFKKFVHLTVSKERAVDNLKSDGRTQRLVEMRGRVVCWRKSYQICVVVWCYMKSHLLLSPMFDFYRVYGSGMTERRRRRMLSQKLLVHRQESDMKDINFSSWISLWKLSGILPVEPLFDGQSIP